MFSIYLTLPAALGSGVYSASNRSRRIMFLGSQIRSKYLHDTSPERYRLSNPLDNIPKKNTAEISTDLRQCRFKSKTNGKRDEAKAVLRASHGGTRSLGKQGTKKQVAGILKSTDMSGFPISFLSMRIP
jgi:hypothetical protein